MEPEKEKIGVQLFRGHYTRGKEVAVTERALGAAFPFAMAADLPSQRQLG